MGKTVEITFIRPDRSIWVDNEKLDINKSLQHLNRNSYFYWGYEGKGADQAAFAILLETYDKAAALKYYKYLSVWIIGSLKAIPSANINSFSILLDLGKFLLLAKEVNSNKKSASGVAETDFYKMIDFKGSTISKDKLYAKRATDLEQ